MRDERTQEDIRELYDIVKRLEDRFPGRHFTPDGHLVGSLGEVYAAEAYGLELFEASHPTHDAKTPDGRLIQVKTTQGNRVALNEKPDFLLVLSLNSEGKFSEIYNGPGEPVWENCGKLQKTGQRHIGIKKLRKLNENARECTRIPLAAEAIQLRQERHEYALLLKKRFESQIRAGAYSFEELLEPEKMWSLKFDMDCYKSLEIACGENCESEAEFARCVPDIDNVFALGSGIFSAWRSVTHWEFGPPDETTIHLTRTLIDRLVEVTESMP